MGIMENILGTKEQNEIAQKNLDKQASEGSKLAKFFGGNPNQPPARTDDLLNRNPNMIMGPNGQLMPNPNYKRPQIDDFVNRNPSMMLGPNGNLVPNPNHKATPAMPLKTGGKVKKYAPGGKIGKIASGLFPGALFGLLCHFAAVAFFYSFRHASACLHFDCGFKAFHCFLREIGNGD